MPWFPVDDTFHSHPKVRATSPAALGLWVVAGSWSMCYLTDGRIKDTDLPRLLPDAAPLADELVSTGLWRRTRDGYVFKDWLQWGNKRSAKEIREVRAKKAAAGRLGGVASGRARSSKPKQAQTMSDSARKKAAESDVQTGPVDNSSEAPNQAVTSGNARSKPASKREAPASVLLEPQSQPFPALPSHKKDTGVAAVTPPVEGVIHRPESNGKSDYAPEFEAERRRQMDALMAMTRSTDEPA